MDDKEMLEKKQEDLINEISAFANKKERILIPEKTRQQLLKRAQIINSIQQEINSVLQTILEMNVISETDIYDIAPDYSALILHVEPTKDKQEG